jgi:kumamolisin
MNAHAHMVPIHGSDRAPAAHGRLVGKADAQKPIKVSIYVRPNPHTSAAASRTIAAMNAELPGRRKYLGGDDFNALFGADPADMAKVAAWAKQHKLSVVESSGPKRRIKVEGTIGDVSAAFGVELKEYEHESLGRYRGREGKLYVPEDMAGVITGVFGLDTRPLGNSRRKRAQVAPVEWETLLTPHAAKAKGKAGTQAAAATNPFPGTFFPPVAAQLYNYPADLDGTGENIAIFAFNGPPSTDPRGGYKLSALQTYFEKVLGGTTPTIADVVVQGPGNDPGPDSTSSDNNGDSTGEVMLDMCVVGSVAPGAKIFMYFTEFTSQGWVDALNDAITDNNQISVISISYGNPESDPESAWTSMGVQQVNQAMQAAMAKGITICCASGDDGSSDGGQGGAEVDFPASSPFVLGVGGTNLVASSSSPPQIASETVWNELTQQEGAGGGGISAVFSLPTYQDGVGVPPSVNPPHTIGRGVPDVCAVADPVTGVVVMRIDGQRLEQIGGTSASTPLWAALIARLNQGLNARCGFINQVLYTKFPSGVLNDITQGNNGDYSAGPGWDACTGLGSPNGQKLLQALSS